jgi:hypothetical protein
MENKNIFEQWDNNADLKGLDKDVHEAEQNGGGNFKEVPHGKHEVCIEKMELKATKPESGSKPMVSIWMKVVGNEDESKGSLIFMNQVITQGFQIHIVNEFLRSLIKECADAPVVEFKSYAQYANLLMDIHELVADSFEYGINYGQTKKGFDTFEVLEVYALED